MKYLNLCIINLLLLATQFSFAQNTTPILNLDQIVEIKINASINPATLDYLKSARDFCIKKNCTSILIRLNTPGGLVSTTKEILTLIGESEIPFIIWIGPEGASATSAGAIIASSAHILVMADGTNIGAATPIEMSGDMGKDLRSKAVNDLKALVMSISETRGRSAELFGKMIESAASYKSKESLEKKLIDGLANNDGEIWKLIDGKKISIKGKLVQLQVNSPTVIQYEMNFGQKLLNIFADPSLSYILFIIGAALIYLEFQAPGGFIAGSIGAICLILAGIGFQVLPLNFGALGLLILAFILFLVEIYIASFGLLAIAGLISFTLGSLFLFRTDDSYLQISHSLIIASVLAIASFILFLGWYWSKDRKNKQSFFSHVEKTGIITEKAHEKDGDFFLYQIKISGELWKAKSLDNFELEDHCTISEHNHQTMILTINKGKK